MNTVVVSRGIVSRSASEMLRAIPLNRGEVSVLSVCSRHRFGHGKNSGNGLSLANARSEGIVKTGNFTNESLRVIGQQKPKVVVISQEAGRPGSLARLASDGLCLLSRGRTPVLLLPTVCSVTTHRRVVIGAMCAGAPSVADGISVPDLLDLKGVEIVVLVIASPSHRPFYLVAAGTRSRRSKVLQETWEHQAGEATVQAGLIAAQLTEEGSKPIFVGRTGRFADEICHATQSADTSLVCLLIGQHARKCLSKSVLLELLEKANAPIMLIPSAGK